MKLKAIFLSAMLVISTMLTVLTSAAHAAEKTDSIKYVKGDVNGSGMFEVADLVLLQKWLLGTETKLADWKAADLCNDNNLDVFDLCLMRKLLIETIAEPRYESTFVRAKDGDTYVVNYNGKDITVRLIGVDTPESVAPASYSKENTEEGKEISDIIKDTIKAGDKLYLEFDVSPTDKYGRTLAYVYFEDGVMVQDWLLSKGYARTMTVPPNVKYAEHFTEVQRIAAENKAGLWNGFFEM